MPAESAEEGAEELDRGLYPSPDDDDDDAADEIYERRAIIASLSGNDRAHSS